MTIQHPKPARPEELLALEGLVAGSCYVRVDERSALPESLQPYASGRFKCLVAASSDFSCSADPPAPQYAPEGPVFLLRNYRYCDHNGSPHFNADDYAFWRDRGGHAWKAPYSDAPDHYRNVVAGTAVSDVWATFGIPRENSGPLGHFREGGAHLDFVDPCPGLWHLRSGTNSDESEGK